MTRKIPLLGTGARISDLPTVLEHFDTCQIFLDNPVHMRPFRIGVRDDKILSRLKGSETTVVIHCSFCTAVLSEGNQQKASIASIWSHIEHAHKYGIKYVVVHPGPLKCRGVTSSKSHSKKTLFEVSMTYSKKMPKGVHLLWENSSGSEEGEHGLDALDVMSVLTRLQACGVKNVGMCLDTQHYYASGCDLRLIGMALDQSTVIHLNGNPADVAHGSFRDNHSKTSLPDSRGLEPHLLYDIVRNYPDKPKIMEANAWACMRSLEWLKEKLQRS